MLLLLQCISSGAERSPKLPLSLGDPDPNLTRGFLGPPEYTVQTASWSGHPSLCSWSYSLPILYYGVRQVFPKLSLPLAGMGALTSHGSLHPPMSTTHTASWFVQQFLQGSRLCPTDRQTDAHRDRPRYIDSNRLHLMLCMAVIVKKKVKFSHTRYRALGPELIPVCRQSACRWLEENQ